MIAIWLLRDTFDLRKNTIGNIKVPNAGTKISWPVPE